MTTISNNDIAKAIYLTLRDKTASEQSLLSRKIVSFLTRRHLLGKSGAILAQLGKIINSDTGTIEAKVLSAKEINEKTKKDLMQFLIKQYGAKKIIIKEIIDKKLFGGFKVEVNDEIIDLTLKNHMNKLEKYLTRSI